MEDERGEGSAEEAEGALAGIGAVYSAEAKGHEQGRDPEAEGVGVDSAGEAGGESGDAARERVLQIAAEEVLLKETDGEEAGYPEERIAKGVVGEEKAAVDDEQACFEKYKDEQRDREKSCDCADEKELRFACSSEAVDREGAALDL
jgi:hypothetical protein